MSLCWLAPAQRPSLRELRIMLLHLRSSRDDLEAAEFDRRWDQLMPRSPVDIAATLPSVITDNDDEEAEMSFSLAPSNLPKRDPVGVHNAMLPMVHGLASPGIPATVRPGSFDSEFSSEWNASLRAEAGSRQLSVGGSFSTSPGNTPDDVTVDDCLTGMAQHFPYTGNERSRAAELNVTTNSLSVFEMVSYEKIIEPEATESKNEIKANIEVDVPDNIPMNPPTSVGPSTVSDDQTGSQETVKDNFDSGEEDWQHFSDSSTNQNMNNSAGQKSEEVSETERVEISADVSNDVGANDQEDAVNVSAAENGHNTERSVGSAEERDSKDGSFCMLKVSVGEVDSPTKSFDVDSPVKSTTSSADWCLVSNHTEHSQEDELDAVSQVTDPSLPGDCVLVESKVKVGDQESLEELSNTDSAVIQDSTSECSPTSAVDKEQPADDTAD